MSKKVLTNARAFAGAVDLTGVTNKVELGAKVAPEDATTYASGGATEWQGGLAATDIVAAGFFDAGTGVLSDADPALFAGLGAVGPWTVAPDTAADGALAYLTNALEVTYKLLGEVGKMAPFEATMKGCTRLARGLVVAPPGVPRTATGVGTAFQLGVVPLGKRLYANLHITSVTGTTPSVTARIESDNAVGFPTPATVLTLAAATAIGGQHLSVAGPFTDDWYRAAWTITGTTPSFLFVISAGIA